MKKCFIFMVFIVLFGCGGENSPQLEKWKTKEAVVEKTSDPNVVKESIPESKKESIHLFDSLVPKENMVPERPWSKPELVFDIHEEKEQVKDGGFGEVPQPELPNHDVGPPEFSLIDVKPPQTPRLYGSIPLSWHEGCDVEVILSGNQFDTNSKVFFDSRVFSVNDPTNQLRLLTSKSGLFEQASFQLQGGYLSTRKTHRIRLQNGNLSSNSLKFVINPVKKPSIFDLRPAKFVYGVNSKTEVRLSGSQGGLIHKGAIFRLNGKVQQSRCLEKNSGCFGDRFEVTLDLKGLQPGQHELTVEGPCIGRSESEVLTIIGPPKPELHELVPGFGKVGTKQNIRIKGKFLTQKTKLLWDNKEVQAKYISPTELEFAADFSNQQARTITVSLEDEFGNQSNLVRFSILDQQTSLTLASATPSSLKNGVLHKSIVVEGSGFTANTELFFGQTKLQVKFHSATKLEITELDLTQALSGSHSLQAEDGGKKSNFLHLYVIPFPAPKIESRAPLKVHVNSFLNVFLRASDFCEREGLSKCKRDPKVLVYDGQGVIVPGVFQVASVGYSSIFGRVSAVGLQLGMYSIRIQRASGELSNTVSLEVLPPKTPMLTMMSKNSLHVGGRFEVVFRGNFFCTPTAQNTCLIPPVVHIVDQNKKDHVGAFVVTKTLVAAKSDWTVQGFLDTSKLSVGQYSVSLEYPTYKLRSNELVLTLKTAQKPFISGLGKKNIEKGKKHRVDVIGNFFSADLTVMMGQKALPTTYFTPDRLSVEIDATNLQAGSYKLHLEDKKQNKSEPYYFAISDPAVVSIFALEWAQETTPYLGLIYQQLTIYGNDLLSKGPNVGFLFNGKPLFEKPSCSGTGVSSSCVLRNLNTKNAGLRVGENTISCQLSDGSKCPDFKFWVYKANAPKITSAKSTGGRFQSIQIQGEFFQPGSKVLIDNQVYIPRYASSTLLSLFFGGKIGTPLSLGNYVVIVENPDGQKSNKVALVIP